MWQQKKPTLSAAPACLHSYMYLGMALHQLGDTDNAVAAYDKAVSLGPAEPLLLLNYGERGCGGGGGGGGDQGGCGDEANA